MDLDVGDGVGSGEQDAEAKDLGRNAEEVLLCRRAERRSGAFLLLPPSQEAEVVFAQPKVLKEVAQLFEDGESFVVRSASSR